jgi:hypothetical protein
MVRTSYAVGLLLLAALLASCSFASRAVKVPDLNPSGAAAAAIKQYDANGDQTLSKDEIEKSALTLELWDADKSGGISQDEIEARLQRYVERGVGMTDVPCYVFLGNAPLQGAEVVFEPEEFLGGAIPPASGTTNESGSTMMSVADEFQPDPPLQAVKVGLYHVRITHPDVTIRPEFNTDTKLSYEVSPLEQPVPPKFYVGR